MLEQFTAVTLYMMHEKMMVSKVRYVFICKNEEIRTNSDVKLEMFFCTSVLVPL